MNSPSLPRPLEPTTVALKRQSLIISTGPRPLHLVDGNIPSSPGPVTAPLASIPHSLAPELSSPSSHKVNTSGKPQPRRHSSISYNPKDRIHDRHTTPRYNLAHGESSNFNPSPRDRRSVCFDVNGIQERPPLTLAEKHSELLHFIAQKESKCLELRSQLALHEAELLQLKRRWEQIINRGLENPHPNDTSFSTNGGGAMLEGIKEGVQGVSRFIAAGLAISELSPVTPGATTKSVRSTHSNSQSSSSISTQTTKSTRLSQSSASSIEEEQLSPSLISELPVEEDVQILMVQDTGATPTMSPNPAFVTKKLQCEEQQRIEQPSQGAYSDFEAGQNTLMKHAETKIHRRKSRDGHSIDIPPLDGFSKPLSHANSTEGAMIEISKMKRANTNGTGFPPVSSIPGLGSLTVGTTTSLPVSSWVGTVGKKWEELQRSSTFSKSQKRASTLLSGVSQTIVSALSPPHSISSPNSPSPPPSYFSPLPPSPMTASSTSTSLLDDDSEDVAMGLTPSSPILIPDLKPKTQSRLISGPIPQPTPKNQEEEEWNW